MVPELDSFSGSGEFFQMSLDLLCVAGFDGRLKRVSPSWTRVLGWSNEELLGRPSIDFVHPDDRAATLSAREVLKADQPLIGFTNRYLCKDGSSRWLEWQSVGHVERQVVYASARDITEQREAERVLQETKELQERMQRQLILTDRLASVGMLAAGVAHEINNPLTYVVANLEFVAEQLQNAVGPPALFQLSQWGEALREAREGSERIRKIVSGLKTLSRVEEERHVLLELGPLLERTANLTLNEIRHRARFVTRYDKTPPVVADEARLGQLFVNLLLNAAQAIPEGDSEGNEVLVETSTDAQGRAQIDVLDTGPGIPSEVLHRIFDPFFTTKAVGVGTGLGLSICHSIVMRLGGEISASNRAARGARLRVVLPAGRPSTHPPPPPVVEEPGNPGRAVVLVVDDELAVTAVVRRILRNHQVTAVNSAQHALELLLADQPFDLILSDLMMPGMSGMELYDTLARERPASAARMVFMSGGAFTPAARAFLDRVPNQRIDKPFQLAMLQRLVQQFAK